MKALPLIARILIGIEFIMPGIFHFNPMAAQYAASQGVPLANILVPLSGIIALIGGLSILLGYKAKLGAWLIVLFLIPVTFMMHRFWAQTDPMQAQMQMSMFTKNLALVGAALLIAYFGAGPYSIDNRAINTNPQV